MVARKNIRTRGKLSLSLYFQKFKEGDLVAIKRNVSVVHKFPKRLQGRTGVIVGKKGKSYILKIKDQNKEKEFFVEAIHLKKIKGIKK